MSKLLQERWQRIAFGTKRIDESGPNTIDRKDGKASLSQLKQFGFYFAGSSSVVLGDLDDMSGKKFKHNYPYDEYMGQGPMHVQISVEKDGTFRIHNYSEVDDAYCTGNMPKKGTVYGSIEEVIEQVGNMIECYNEWMDAYCQIRDAGGTLDNEESYAPAFIMDEHPAAQALRKK